MHDQILLFISLLFFFVIGKFGRFLSSRRWDIDGK
jgi:hypothetical protein